MTEQIKNEPTNLVDALRAEVALGEKNLRNSKIVGVVLAIFAFSYLQWGYSQIRKVVDPELLAEASVGYAREHLSTALDAAGAAAKDRAPEMVGQLYASLGNYLEGLRAEAEAKIRDGDSVYGTEVQNWVREYFSNLVRENQQLKLASDDDPKVAAKAFLGLGKGVRTDVETMFSEGMDHELGEATDHLSKVSGHLRRLAGNNGLTKEEKEERELIVAILQFIDPDLGTIKELRKLRTEFGAEFSP